MSRYSFSLQTMQYDQYVFRFVVIYCNTATGFLSAQAVVLLQKKCLCCEKTRLNQRGYAVEVTLLGSSHALARRNKHKSVLITG